VQPDLADHLVKRLNIPFRDANHITGEIGNLAEDRGVEYRVTAERFTID